MSRLRQSASEILPGSSPTFRKYPHLQEVFCARLRRGGRQLGCAAQRLGAYACRYVNEWRMAGLSDHAAMEVDFAPVGAGK